MNSISPTRSLPDPYFDRTAGKILYQGRWWKAQYDGKDVLDPREQEKIFKRLQYEHQNTQLATSSLNSKKIVFTNEKVLVYPKTGSTNYQEVLTTSGRNAHDIIQQRQRISVSFQKIKDLIQTKKLDQKKERTWHPAIETFFPTAGTPPSTFKDWDEVYKKLEEEIERLKKQKHDPLQNTPEIEERLHLHRIYKAYVTFEREKLRPTAPTALHTISLVPTPPPAPHTALPQAPARTASSHTSPPSAGTTKTEEKPIDLSSIHLDVTASESERQLETSTPPPSADTTGKEGAPVELGDISVVMLGSKEDRSPKTLPPEKFIQQICEDFFPEDKKLTKPERAARLRILAILHKPNSDILNCYKEIDKELLIKTLRTDALALNSALLKIDFGLVSTSPKKVTKEVEKFFEEKIQTLESLARQIEAAPKT